ncbi:MAG TPA: glycosyltransferase family 39 protein [Prolixibacteraceae bacterium]|nr:glycosyltransferase family 39 protein [Prolixibacteraceae bacterium]
MNKTIRNRIFRPAFLSLAILLFFTIIRIILADITGLGIDESYNARGILHLRWAYIDHPPLFYSLSHLSVGILGLNNLAIRLPSILLFAGTHLLLYAATRRLFHERAALWAVVLLNLSFIFTFPVATWCQPDAPLLFFWMLSVYLSVRIFFPSPADEPGKGKFLLWACLGLSIGLATWSKYHSVFLPAGLFLFMAFHKQHRHWLKKPAPYLGFLLFLLILLPLILWNYRNDWVSFSLQFSRALPEKGLSLHPEWLLRNIVGQALWLSPWIWWPLMGQLVRTIQSMKTDPKNAFLFWLAVLPILFFTLITLWADTQYRFHWQAPGYLILLIPLGHSFSRKETINPAPIRRFVVAASLLLLLLSGVFTAHMITGFWQFWGPGKITRMTGGHYDPTLEGVDFDAIRERFEKNGWLENPNVFVGGVRWWQAGKTDWALRCKKEMVVFDRNISNYTLYQNPSLLIGKDAVIVRFPGNNSPPDVALYFDTLTRLEDIEIIRGGRTELLLEVFYGTRFHRPDTGKEDYLFGGNR